MLAGVFFVSVQRSFKNKAPIAHLVAQQPANGNGDCNGQRQKRIDGAFPPWGN